MGLLARREHGSQELLVKLRQRFRRRTCPDEQVQDVLTTLTKEGLLSDERFALSTVRQLVSRGYGPRRITETFRQQGIEGYLSGSIGNGLRCPDRTGMPKRRVRIKKSITVPQLWVTGMRVSARGRSECGFYNIVDLTLKYVRPWFLMAQPQTN